MKLAILGTGMIVDMILPFYSSLAIEKTYLLSTPRSLDKARQLQARYGFDGVFDDYDQLLNEADIDTVYIALPNHLHFAYALKAIEHGCHVICEKPMVTTVNEMDQLIKASQAHHVIILEAMTIHYLPMVQQLKSVMNTIGDLKLGTLTMTQYSSRYDAFRQGRILPAFDPKCAGGALYDINVYNLHLALMVFGIPEKTTYHAHIEHDIDTHGTLILDYGHFEVLCIGAKDCFGPSQSSIKGTNGVIEYNGASSMLKALSVTYKNGEETVLRDEFDYAHRYEFEAMIDIIDHGNEELAQTYLDISHEACRIMEESRRQAAIIFDHD